MTLRCRIIIKFLYQKIIVNIQRKYHCGIYNDSLECNEIETKVYLSNLIQLISSEIFLL